MSLNEAVRNPGMFGWPFLPGPMEQTNKEEKSADGYDDKLLQIKHVGVLHKTIKVSGGVRLQVFAAPNG